jgi:hypothetical protein
MGDSIPRALRGPNDGAEPGEERQLTVGQPSGDPPHRPARPLAVEPLPRRHLGAPRRQLLDQSTQARAIDRPTRLEAARGGDGVVERPQQRGPAHDGKPSS